MVGGALKSKVFLPDEVGSDLPVTMWYFEQSFGVVCKVPLRSSRHEGLCLFSPEEIYWLWITCVWQDYISWLVLWSIQQFTSNWKWNAPDPALVFICWYRTIWWFFKYWPFDEELRASFPTNYTISDTRASHCQSSDSWMLVSLLPDLEVSDLEKSQSNQKSNGDNLSLHCLKLWWPQMLWVFVFCIQRSWPVLWCLGALHGFGWMHVYFQVGMIIGDTEQHNKQYMWLPWRKWLT